MIIEARIKKLQSKYNELIEACKVFADESDLKKIEQAYRLAYHAEIDESNKSGELNLLHSVEIALISVNEIGLGVVVVICTFMHNLVEAKAITTTEIEEIFGKSIAGIVEGFNKVSSLQTGRISAQSDNFRKLFLTIADDIRVILLKVAHRLYDMRYYDNLSAIKKERYLDEVVYLYIPIAHRLGLYTVKSDLEELSMKYANPEIYYNILEKIQASKKKQKSFLEEFIHPIQRELIKQDFDCEFKSRPKSVYSIWNKMKRQNVSFDEVYDILAVRIISNSKPTKEKEDCWKIYSIVSDIYQPNPKRLRDWISTPKASGYESLHTTVKAGKDKWVEVQIRTDRMDRDAEKGQAAHWRYKGFGTKKDSESWLGQVRDILENPNQINFDQAFLENNKSKETDKIFIFTPNGDLKQLPNGSTVLDFAYEIHTDVGSKCNGAKVNNKIVQIRHILKNSDKVEIITSKNQKPKLDWLNFVTTNKAKSRIKRAMLEDKYQEADAGNEIVRRKFRNWKIPFNDETLDKIIKHYKYKSSIDFYYAVAKETTDLAEVKKVLLKADDRSQREESVVEVANKTAKVKEESLLITEQISHITYSLAKCCNPISGDAVFGFVTVGKGITIHRVNCPNASQMLSKYSYRVIDVKWKEAAGELSSFIANVKVSGKDSIGLFGELTNVISTDLKVNMQSISVNSKKGSFEGNLKLQVKDDKHLDELIYKLLKIKDVTKVTRVDAFKK